MNPYQPARSAALSKAEKAVGPVNSAPNSHAGRPDRQILTWAELLDLTDAAVTLGVYSLLRIDTAPLWPSPEDSSVICYRGNLT